MDLTLQQRINRRLADRTRASRGTLRDFQKKKQEYRAQLAFLRDVEVERYSALLRYSTYKTKYGYYPVLVAPKYRRLHALGQHELYVTRDYAKAQYFLSHIPLHIEKALERESFLRWIYNLDHK